MRNNRLQWFLAAWIPVLIGGVAASFVLKRELWFDEALTVRSFMLPLRLPVSPGKRGRLSFFWTHALDF
jgi:hypothetical protein